MRANLWVALLLLLACGVWAGDEQPKAASTSTELDIRPKKGAPWGAGLEDVDKVLHAAAGELWKYVPGRQLPPILVEPKGGPITLFDRGPNGEFRVRLDTGDAYWAQYTYQFAHEFCHILCGNKE
ncbi:MAG: hypothetical protein NTW87_01155, partial [Planctomycetota bacterium]|nr:hypothetical protein [Planctomycetota bacterium]